VELKELYQRAIAHYGPEAQTRKTLEEMAKLQVELCHHACGRATRLSIAEEIADVQIMLEQMSLLHDCADAVELFRRRKLERLEEKLDPVPLA